MSKYFSTPQKWDDYVDEYHAVTAPTRNGPVMTELLSIANAERPFSTATAVLDNACGTGNVIEGVITMYGSSIPASSRLLASDYSPGMIAFMEKLKANPPESGSRDFWQRLELRVLDSVDLFAEGNSPDDPLIKPGSLSHVLSYLGLYAVADFKAAIKSTYDALEDGGVLVMTGAHYFPWIEHLAFARPVAPERDWDMRSPVVWRSKEAMESLLRDIGFTHTTIHVGKMPMERTKESMKMFLESFINSKNPMSVDTFGGLSEDKVDEGIQLILEGTEKEYGGWPLTLQGESFTVCARK